MARGAYLTKTAEEQNLHAPKDELVHNKNNIIKKDFQEMLLPLDILSNIFFQQKYHIRQNRITPNGKISNVIVYSAWVIFMHALLYVYKIIYLSKALNNYSDHKQQYILIVSDIVIATWMLKNFILLSVLCYEHEKFYRNVNDAQLICLLLLKKQICSDNYCEVRQPH
ncbi:uncharacterized protein LOC131854207 [Achroia grisella]|uniref:uncharacterized protein LOC131854207 n=1 Tax=Achroia grisella TaxID=688607 RepID=UPI0027D24341|nr:uncharacterized protein LOC131854207 [Achroia grisella]